MVKKYVIVFEDEPFNRFYPLSLSHPVFNLLAGAKTNLERVIHHFRGYEIYTCCRPHLPDVWNRMAADDLRNLDGKPDGGVILINGSVVVRASDFQWINELKNRDGSVAYVHNGILVAALLPLKSFRDLGEEAVLPCREGFSKKILENSEKTEHIDILRFSYIWDPMRLNSELIESDFEEYFKDRAGKIDIGEPYCYGKSDLFAGEGVSGDAAAVIDARKGPVIIAGGVEIKPFTFLEGPAFIGRGTKLVGGKLTGGCSIGAGCRIGGEVESTIIIGNTNKYHEGFIGHSYIGQWVNLGALTTNSDLANNYSEIRVRQNGAVIHTGHMKIGSFIGDHTKIGIGMTLNTGAVIGFSCNLFGGSLILEKEVPSFAWGNDSIRSRVKLKDAIRTAEIVMGRRDFRFKAEHSRLFEHIFDESQKRRESWIKRKRSVS